VKRFLFATAALVMLAGASAWWWARGSLPTLDGQLVLPGLHAPVEILFDDYGVPSVYAAATDDAWFAAGALHARDRLWQMELYRRVTLGRLSEVLGERTVVIDRRFLTLGLREAAEAEWAGATPAVKAALERYAAGVNAVAAGLGGRRRPLEFQLLGITPAPWTPVDSLAVGRLLAWRLSENHQAELVRGGLAAKFGVEVARELGGGYPVDAPDVLGSGRRRPDGGESAARAPVPELRAAIGGPPAPPVMARGAEWPGGLEWLHPGARRGNSNNWVVAGRKTRSGRPILANDPHLLIEFPSVWYEMHLVAAGLDVAGVTIPGVPFVALGHNARIAWGMTSTGADVQDVFLERIDVGRQRVYSRGGWVPVAVTPVDIPVRGLAKPIRFEIWKTRNGPIFSDTGLDWDAAPAWLSPDGRQPEERRAYSIRNDAGGDLAAAFEALNRAGDWAAFTSAVDTLSALSMNVVYADVDGNIGYAMSGRLPIRTAGDGAFPIDGANGATWAGAIGGAALPRVLNPPAGFIASANNEIDRGFAGVMTRDWAAPFRAVRLSDALAAAGDLDMDGMLALQNDRRSLAADAVLAGTAGAIALARGRDGDAPWVAVLERLAKWDRIVDARPIVTLYQAFEHALWRRTFGDEMGDPLFLKFYEWAGAERMGGLHAVIGEPRSRWFDDITTVDRRETRDDIFLLAARDAEERLQQDFGGDSRRAWDVAHGAPFNHPLGGVALPLRWLFNRGPVPIAGDGTTVMRVSWNRLAPFAAWELPSWRQVFDTGQWDDARVSLPSGQSGHPMSPHYFDQSPIWREGGYRVQPFSRAAVQAAARHRLLLVP
jgi:penicillin amidase